MNFQDLQDTVLQEFLYYVDIKKSNKWPKDAPWGPNSNPKPKDQVLDLVLDVVPG